MGLISILSILFTIFSIILFLKREKAGKTSVIFGILTFVFITSYNYMGEIPIKYFNIGLFIFFSIMILNFGLMTGSIALMLSKSNKLSIITSIITSTIITLLMFKMTGLLAFMVIPISLYILQFKFNELTNY